MRNIIKALFGSGNARGSDFNDRVRIEAKNEWLKNAADLARKTKHFHARQIMEILETSATAAPHPDGLRCLEKKGQNAPFVVPLLTDEDALCPQWKRLIESGQSVAYFIRELHAIVVRHNSSCSPVWRGLIFLHEASHAYQSLTNPEAMTDLGEEESRVYAFENRLIEMLFGAAYSSILEEAVSLLEREAPVRNGKVEARFGPLLPFIQKVETVYGPALSEEEKRARHACFVTHAYFSLFDRRSSESQNLKRAFAAAILVPK